MFYYHNTQYPTLAFLRHPIWGRTFIPFCYFTYFIFSPRIRSGTHVTVKLFASGFVVVLHMLCGERLPPRVNSSLMAPLDCVFRAHAGTQLPLEKWICDCGEKWGRIILSPPPPRFAWRREKSHRVIFRQRKQSKGEKCMKTWDTGMREIVGGRRRGGRAPLKWGDIRD